MRTKFVEGAMSSREARNECPWAAHTVKVVGGYMCFESHTDYAVWRNQK